MRQLMTIILSLVTCVAMAQSNDSTRYNPKIFGYGWQYNRLKIDSGAIFRGRLLSGVSNDATGASKDSTKLITERAAKNYADSLKDSNYLKTPLYSDNDTIKLHTDSMPVLTYYNVFTNQLSTNSLIPKHYLDSMIAVAEALIPTNNNTLTNGAGYITSAAITGKVNYTDTVSMIATQASLDYISVKKYGAAGDGVTVDTLAVQNAALAARASGKSLCFPAGTYNLPFTNSTELSGIPKVFGDNAVLSFNNMTKLNGVRIDSFPYPTNTSNAVFTVTGHITLLQSGATTTVGGTSVSLNAGLNLKSGDILFFTSTTTLPYGQNSTYYEGQRAVVDSFNNSTGLCYINGQFFYAIPNAYVWINDTVPNCEFGEGLILKARPYNTIIGVNAKNAIVNVYGSYYNFGKAGISVTNCAANISARLINNFFYNNGNSYGISVCDLSDANILNSTINGSKLCVASGGGDYWNANQSGGSSGSAAYPSNIFINGGTYRPSNIQNQGALDAHSSCRQLNIANANIFSAVYTQAEYTSVQNCDIFYNLSPAIEIATKDTTSGYVTIDNVRCYASGGSLQGGIQMFSGVKSLAITNSIINHNATTSTGALMLNFPNQILKISNLEVNESGNTDSYVYQYTNNFTIDGLRSSGATVDVTPQVDSLLLNISNSSFSNCISTTQAGMGLKIYSSHVINQVNLNNCRFLNNAGNGAKIGFNTLNLLVSGCIANNNGKGGLYSAIESSGINASLVKNVTVVNSNLSNTGSQPYGLYHYGLSAPSYYNIQNTNFTGNTTANYLIQNGALPGFISSNIDKAGGIISNNLTSTSTLASGTVTVTAVVKTGATIILTRITPSGTLGFLSVGTITNNTSFVINSSSSTDNSTVNWLIKNP